MGPDTKLSMKMLCKYVGENLCVLRDIPFRLTLKVNQDVGVCWDSYVSPSNYCWDKFSKHDAKCSDRLYNYEWHGL